jgi:hypothetical protein
MKFVDGAFPNLNERKSCIGDQLQTQWYIFMGADGMGEFL